jgi:hypothetical protein
VPRQTIPLTTLANLPCPAWASKAGLVDPSDAYSAARDRYACVRSPSGAFQPNRYIFAEIKDVGFTRGHVESEVVRGADQALIRPPDSTISSEFRHLRCRCDFRTNYLDLRDGHVAEIAVRGLTEDVGDDQLWAGSGLA